MPPVEAGSVDLQLRRRDMTVATMQTRIGRLLRRDPPVVRCAPASAARPRIRKERL